MGRAVAKPRLLLFMPASYNGPMIRTILPIGLLASLVLAPVPAIAQPQLSLEQRTMLRCSAAFAIVARQQADGRPDARRYPPMDPRGKEFFVRASAQLMDEAKLTREQVQAALLAEARNLSAPAMLDAVMPACLLSLDASGL